MQSFGIRPPPPLLSYISTNVHIQFIAKELSHHIPHTRLTPRLLQTLKNAQIETANALLSHLLLHNAPVRVGEEHIKDLSFLLDIGVASLAEDSVFEKLSEAEVIISSAFLRRILQVMQLLEVAFGMIGSEF